MCWMRVYLHVHVCGLLCRGVYMYARRMNQTEGPPWQLPAHYPVLCLSI